MHCASWVIASDGLGLVDMRLMVKDNEIDNKRNRNGKPEMIKSVKHLHVMMIQRFHSSWTHQFNERYFVHFFAT